MDGPPYQTILYDRPSYRDGERTADGICEIAANIIEINKKYNGPKGGRFRLTVSVSNFVPKADTPFQWERQNTPRSSWKSTGI